MGSWKGMELDLVWVTLRFFKMKNYHGGSILQAVELTKSKTRVATHKLMVTFKKEGKVRE